MRPLTSFSLFLAAACAALALGSSAAGAATFTAQTVDGPSPAILSLGGVAVARDGTGALVYLKTDGGVAHVFASLLSRGSWSSPIRVDAGLTAAASQPTVAVGVNGRAEFAFLSGSALYGVIIPGVPEIAAAQQPTPGAAQRTPSAPQQIATAATMPSAAMTQHGRGYIAFAVPGPPSQVLVAYAPRKQSTFQTTAQPLNVDPNQNAGDSGLRRPRLAPSADGSVEVSWGESGADGRTHVFVKRVFGGTATGATQDLTQPSFGSHAGHDADSPSIGLEDNGSLGWAVFRQSFDDSPGPHTRALASRLVGSSFGGVAPVDGLSFPAEGTDDPRLVLTGLGAGLSAVGLAADHQTVAALESNNAFAAPRRLSSAPNTIPPQPAPALGENDRGLVAWEQASGATPASVRARVLANNAFGPERVLSNAAFGQVNPADPLSASADGSGDVFVAFVQGAASDQRIAVGGLAQPPSRFLSVGKPDQRCFRTNRPTLAWEPSNDSFGPVFYRILVDGHVIGRTTTTRFRSRKKIGNGKHRLAIQAVDIHGQVTVATYANKLAIDTSGHGCKFTSKGKPHP